MVLPLKQPRGQPIPLRKPIRQPIRLPLYPTIMSQPQRTVDLPGGKIVNGELILDESPEAWRQFSRREERQIEPSILDGPQPETLDFKEEMRKLGKGLVGGLLGLIPAAEGNILPEDQDFFNNYIHNYYAGKDVDKVSNAKANAKNKLSELRDGSLSIPPIAQNAIDIAVDIFGTDYGKDGKARKKRYGEDRLREDLERIGAIESEYVHLKNLEGGSDSGYWQVQPSTAKDSLENASEHFGEEFDKKFAPEGWSYDELLQMTEDDIQDLMRVKKKENQALAASFAAVKILQTFDY